MAPLPLRIGSTDMAKLPPGVIDKISREELHKLVWSVSVRQASSRLGVSGVYIGKICTALDVPRPGRGWWAKRKAGREPAPTRLPPARPGHPIFWERGAGSNPIFTYYTDRDLWQRSRELGWHPLALIAQRSLSNARPGPAGILIGRAGNTIDLAVTENMLDAAVRLANALFMSLEAKGHSVAVAVRQPFIRPQIDLRFAQPIHQPQGLSHTRAPRWPTVATIAGVPIGLAVVELHHEEEMQYLGDGQFAATSRPVGKRPLLVTGITWKQQRLVPNRELKIVAYSPVHSSPWRREWRIDDPGKSQGDIDGIILELETRAHGQKCIPATQMAAPPEIMNHTNTAHERLTEDSLVADQS